MTKLKYTFKSDILFKMVFVKYPKLLKELVAVILGISVESITEFVIDNTEITPESIEKKFCRLDINMRVNHQRVDIEMQVANEGNYPERVMFYWARQYSAALSAGQDYSELPCTIIISIIDFNLFHCMEYHSFFQLLETTRYELLSDKMGFHFFELPKLPANVSKDDPLLLWMSLFNADTEEELEKIKTMGVPIMSEAINAYHSVTNSPEYRELERLREKAEHDEAQALHHARQVALAEGMEKGMREGIEKGLREGMEKGIRENTIKIAQNLIEMGMSNAQIIKLTGLSQEEVKRLRTAFYSS